jgi:hypothetical protein
MNSKKSKLIVKSLILALSVVCFLVVNTSNVDNTTNSNVPNLTNVESSPELPIKDSRMPDLKLVKNALILIGKFLPAK